MCKFPLCGLPVDQKASSHAAEITMKHRERDGLVVCRYITEWMEVSRTRHVIDVTYYCWHIMPEIEKHRARQTKPEIIPKKRLHWVVGISRMISVLVCLS